MLAGNRTFHEEGGMASPEPEGLGQAGSMGRLALALHVLLHCSRNISSGGDSQAYPWVFLVQLSSGDGEETLLSL